MLESNQVQPVISSVVTPVALEGFKTPLLNKYTGAAAAYSLRRLKSWDDGKRVVEVRRSSDSTTQDFTASQITNGDLVAFCGAGDGFVSTWYDQSGNANDATQATTTSQPKIVDAGVLLNEIKFDGADDVLNFTEIDFSTNSWMLSAVVDWDGSLSPVVGGSISQWSLQVATSDNFSSRATSDNTIHNFDPTASIVIGDGLFTVQRSSDVLSGYYDGVFDDAAPAITAASEFKADKIGQRGSFYGSSGVKEIIIYQSDQSANRAGIEANINDFYSIY